MAGLGIWSGRSWGAEAIPAGLAELNLPVDFVRRVAQHTLMDEYAAKAVQEALGTDVKVVRIFAQELQRQDGALHGVAAAHSTL